MVSAASSGISQPNSSSNAMTSSTVSRLSAPRSSIKLAPSVTFSASTPRCSTTIFFTRSPMSLIALTSYQFRLACLVDATFGRRQSPCEQPTGTTVEDQINGRERTVHALSGPVNVPQLTGVGYHTSPGLTSMGVDPADSH